jgi:hypothetical protein
MAQSIKFVHVDLVKPYDNFIICKLCDTSEQLNINAALIP